ncbi:sodium-dependent transporter [Maritimibacter harenae]|uniref:sodium-dependent transporter n=1 Tax=Maritimibacter harenae TaxID=2606218 RepID=UPI00136FF0D7|nr:sodium-dependent transporter [Maritimibacter harenae]
MPPADPRDAQPDNEDTAPQDATERGRSSASENGSSDGPRAAQREPTARPREESSQAAAGLSDVSREAAHRREEPYATWSSERAFVLSTAAAGVGLGNLWRFPTLVGENGGGAFLVAYAIAVVAFAIPFAALEVAAGRNSHGSVIASFRRLGRAFVAFGVAVVLLTLMINSYYFVVTGWTFGYAVESTLGAPPAFGEFSSGFASVWWLGGTGAVVAAILAFGLSGIERAAQFLMPVLLLALGGIAIYGLQNGAAGEAMDFLFSTDATRFADPGLWRAAFGQAFFSMTIGQGYLITYGSYLPRRVHVPRAVASIAAMNSGVAILAGIAIFPLVFAAGLSPDAGSELAFETLPKAFENMGAGGILAPVFFWLLFLAALSSCLGGAKVVTAALREQWRPFGQVSAVIAGILAIVALAVPSALSYSAAEWRIAGEPVLDAVDRTIGSNGVILAAIGSSLILGWRFSPGHLCRQFGLRHGAARTLAWIVRLGPLGLGVLFGVTTVT